MNWSYFASIEEFEGETVHFTTMWDDEGYPLDEIDYSDIDPQEIIARKESLLLTQIWLELDKLLNSKKATIDFGELKYASFQIHLNDYFTTEEAVRCKESLFKFYSLCRNALARKRTWIGFASFFDTLAGFPPEGNILLSELKDRRSESVIQSEIGVLIQSFKQILLKAKLECRSVQDICDNLILFSDEELILKLSKIGGVKWRASRITYLHKLNRCLVGHEAARLKFSYSTHCKIFPVERELGALSNWVGLSIQELTPLIPLSSRENFEIMRIKFLDLVDEGSLIIHDLDNLLESMFLLEGAKKDKIILRYFSISVGSSGKASTIISALFNKLRNFKTGSSKADIQNWIMCLFFNFRGKGFSLAHIRKVTD